MKMRVFVEKTLRYYLLGQGQEMLPAGPYSVTPLGAGYMPEPANSVAKGSLAQGRTHHRALIAGAGRAPRPRRHGDHAAARMILKKSTSVAARSWAMAARTSVQRQRSIHPSVR
jgi:hypothetical protein